MVTTSPKAEACCFKELKNARILIADDDPFIREMIIDLLCGEVGELTGTASCRQTESIVSQKPFDLGLIDINFPDGNGFELISRLKRIQPDMKFIVLTGGTDADMVYALEKSGIQTLIAKPFNSMQLKFCMAKEMAKTANRLTIGTTEGAAPTFSDLIGTSPYIHELRRKIEYFANSDIPILIQGPTGTGKEIIAKAIHTRSHRHDKSMITVNSSAIPEHLEESEFFGYAKGAFTGAYQPKEGIFKCAHASSLFLDEVGELSLRIQAKLLRVLDGHEFYRIGETKPVQSKFRLISATNRPLKEMITSGSFREDLYFRLKAGLIMTQSLVKHKEDIPLLARHFVDAINQEKNCDFKLTDGAIEVFMHYAWPGNIRELKNTLASICTVCVPHEKITRENVLYVLSESTKEDSAPVIPFSAAKLNFERDYYRSLLYKFNGNISMASRASGIERSYFSKRIKAYGFSKGDSSAQNTFEQETTHTAIASLNPSLV